MDKIQSFLYNTLFGRIILKALIQPPVSKICGCILNTRISALFVNKFINTNKIDMSDYLKTRYSSFNDFFTRKIIDEKRPVDMDNLSLISPCDGALTVYNIDENSTFRIKHSVYTVSDLLEESSADYIGGKCLVFRLAVHNYHRYCYIDKGTKSENKKISGCLHTVMPISADYNVFSRNSREWTILHTQSFGDVIQIEIGALLVGKINNYHQTHMFCRGEEKGRFEFGGSTIVLLFKKGTVLIDEKFTDFKETPVLMGEKIGIKSSENFC